LPTFIRTLRKLHPNTPILLNESPRYPAVAFLSEQMQRVTESNTILDRIGKDQAASGDHHIAVISAADLAAESGETTVDGIHPTDVGFVIMAEAIEPTLRKAID
jgi:lysophospholipase L1-like esterase